MSNTEPQKSHKGAIIFLFFSTLTKEYKKWATFMRRSPRQNKSHSTTGLLEEYIHTELVRNMNESDFNLRQDMFWNNDTFEYYDFDNDTSQACYGASNKVCENILNFCIN